MRNDQQEEIIWVNQKQLYSYGCPYDDDHPGGKNAKYWRDFETLDGLFDHMEKDHKKTFTDEERKRIKEMTAEGKRTLWNFYFAIQRYDDGSMHGQIVMRMEPRR